MKASIDEAVSARRVSGVNLLGRWRGNVAGGQGQLQAYFDRAIARRAVVGTRRAGHL
jgi:hypothetical protein